MPATLERTETSTVDATTAAAGDRLRSRPPARRPDRPRPVFASETQRRAKLLRLVAWTLAGLTALWLAALVLGAFGLRPLPAVGLPQVPGASDEPRTPGAEPSKPGSRSAATSRQNEEGPASSTAGAPDSGGRAGDGATASERRSAERGTTTGERDAGTPSAGTDGGTGSGSTATPAPTTTPAAPTTTGNGSSATAPGAVNRPDRTTDTAPGNSGSAPGATTSGDRRGGPKATTTSP